MAISTFHGCGTLNIELQMFLVGAICSLNSSSRDQFVVVLLHLRCASGWLHVWCPFSSDEHTLVGECIVWWFKKESRIHHLLRNCHRRTTATLLPAVVGNQVIC